MIKSVSSIIRKRLEKTTIVQLPKDTDGSDICTVCIFSEVGMSDNISDGLVLKCCRYPPTVVSLGAELVQTRPDAVGWCGEFKRREK